MSMNTMKNRLITIMKPRMAKKKNQASFGWQPALYSGHCLYAGFAIDNDNITLILYLIAYLFLAKDIILTAITISARDRSLTKIS